jgi:predicted RNA-binding protein with RPS1 domain
MLIPCVFCGIHIKWILVRFISSTEKLVAVDDGALSSSNSTTPATPVLIGQTYRDCLITSVTSFGIFVALASDAEAMVHVSELDLQFIGDAQTAGFEVGGRMDVKIIAKTPEGKYRGSRKALLLREKGKDDREKNEFIDKANTVPIPRIWRPKM